MYLFLLTDWSYKRNAENARIDYRVTTNLLNTNKFFNLLPKSLMFILFQ